MTLNLGVLPGLFTLAVSLSNRAEQQTTLRTAIACQGADVASYAQALLPLGMMSWVAFTLSFALPKAHYVLSVISDPFGWGWDLFGTAGAEVYTGLTGPAQILQIGALLGGLVWSVSVTRKKTPDWRANLPVVVFFLIYTMVMLWVLI